MPPAFLQSVWFKLTGAIAMQVCCDLHLIRLRTLQGESSAVMSGCKKERIVAIYMTRSSKASKAFLLRSIPQPRVPKAEPAQVFEEALQQSDQMGRPQLVLDLRASNAESSSLPNALAASGRELQSIYAGEFKVIVNGNPHPLHPIVYEESFRIANEALGNAFRHSRAREVEAELNFAPNELSVRVRDDGVGIDSKVLEHGFRAGHWGLPGMRERAQKIGAHLDVWSQLGRGTEIELRVPAAIAYKSAAAKRGFRWLRQVAEEREEPQ